MVTAKHDDSVLVKSALLQSAEEFTDAVIDVTNRTVVSTPSPLDLVIGEILIPHISDLHEPLAVRILLLLGDLDFR